MDRIHGSMVLVPRAAFRIVAAVSALFWGVLFFGLVDLAVVFQQDTRFYESYVLETGWGLLFTVMVAAALAVVAIRPRWTSLIDQLVVVAGCVALTGVAAIALLQVFAAAGLLLNAAVLRQLLDARSLLTGDEWEVWRGRSPRLPVLVVGCVALLPSIVIAFDLVRGFWQLRPPTDDDTWDIDHWPMQAALALAVAAVTLLASLGAPGWRASLSTAALSAAGWGGVSIWYPEHAASLGTVGGWIAIGWALVAMLSSAIPVWRRRSSSAGTARPSPGVSRR